MYAIIEACGRQYKVQEGETVYFEKLDTEEGKKVSEMIAHEGYNTTPQFYRIPRLLKIDKKSYYCERILDNSNPDIVFLKDKEAVAKYFEDKKAEEEKKKIEEEEKQKLEEEEKKKNSQEYILKEICNSYFKKILKCY